MKSVITNWTLSNRFKFLHSKAFFFFNSNFFSPKLHSARFILSWTNGCFPQAVLPTFHWLPLAALGERWKLTCLSQLHLSQGHFYAAYLPKKIYGAKALLSEDLSMIYYIHGISKVHMLLFHYLLARTLIILMEHAFLCMCGSTLDTKINGVFHACTNSMYPLEFILSAGIWVLLQHSKGCLINTMFLNSKNWKFYSNSQKETRFTEKPKWFHYQVNLPKIIFEASFSHCSLELNNIVGKK